MNWFAALLVFGIVVFVTLVARLVLGFAKRRQWRRAVACITGACLLVGALLYWVLITVEATA
jgi:cytochrome c biogenesis protein CcdA